MGETINTIERKKKHSVPHVFVILFFLVLLASIATWIVPPGQFDYEKVEIDGTVRTLVVPDSFHYIDRVDAHRATPLDFFDSFHRGLVSAADIAMMIFIVNGAFAMIIKTGSIHAMMGSMLKKFNGKEKFLIPLFFLVFAFGASLFGMWNEFNGLIPIITGLGVALGYDALFGFAIVELGIGIGFASALMNPYTIVVAQQLAGVPIYSGAWLRVLIFVIFSALGIFWIYRYGHMIRKDPSRSLMYGEHTQYSFEKSELMAYELNGKRKLILLEILVFLVILFYGFIKLGWGTTQLTGIFLAMGIIAVAIDGWSPNKIAVEFIHGCGDIAFGALVVGVAKAVLVIMQDGVIVDTIINACASQLSSLPPALAAIGMLIIQTMVNFVIPSGSGQAATMIPIMAPLGDLLGLTRETVILAFQFGDGYSNLLWPTANIAVGCGIAGIPITKWWKFFIPLFGLIFAVQCIFMLCAVFFGLGA